MRRRMDAPVELAGRIQRRLFSRRFLPNSTRTVPKLPCWLSLASWRWCWWWLWYASLLCVRVSVIVASLYVVVWRKRRHTTPNVRQIPLYVWKARTVHSSSPLLLWVAHIYVMDYILQHRDLCAVRYTYVYMETCPRLLCRCVVVCVCFHGCCDAFMFSFHAIDARRGDAFWLHGSPIRGVIHMRLCAVCSVSRLGQLKKRTARQPAGRLAACSSRAVCAKCRWNAWWVPGTLGKLKMVPLCRSERRASIYPHRCLLSCDAKSAHPFGNDYRIGCLPMELTLEL